jgi:hypothetical protein
MLFIIVDKDFTYKTQRNVLLVAPHVPRTHVPPVFEKRLFMSMDEFRDKIGDINFEISFNGL